MTAVGKRHQLPADLGARLRAHRLALRLTQAAAAELLDVDESTVSYVESGRRAMSEAMVERWIFRLGLPGVLASELRAYAVPNVGLSRVR